MLLPSWTERAILAGLTNTPDRRFLKGAFNGLPGIDGWIRGAQVRDEFKQYIPDGDSFWEFSVQTAAKTKIRKDAAKRIAGQGVTAGPSQQKTPSKKTNSLRQTEVGWTPETTTIVFVTPRGVANADDLAKQIATKAKWKEVRIIDGQRLFDWLEICPAIALAWAAEIHGVNISSLKVFDVAWDEIAGTTNPKLTKEIVIAGRDESRSALIQQIKGEPKHIFVRGDSDFEAQAFVLSALQDADCQRERDRALVAQSYESALIARNLAPSIFVVNANNHATTSALSDSHRHHVVVTFGDPLHSPTAAIELERPRRWDFAKGLEASGLEADEAERLARECGSSVTVMCRRRSSGVYKIPWWAIGNEASFLRPFALLGRWDTANENDRSLLEEFSGRNWDSLQQSLVNYIDRDSAPLVRVGQVWALGSHVDALVMLGPRLGDSDFKRFASLVRKVFAPVNPLSVGKDPDDLFELPKGPSDWLKQGIAQTLLLLAVRSSYFEPTLVCPIPSRGQSDTWHPGTPNEFVDAILGELPSLGTFLQLYESIKQQFVVLIEASPDPLLDALERWLEGRPDEVQRMLSATRGLFQDWPDVTELLWGLEAIAWSPDYLFRVSRILAMLARLKPASDDRDANRPLEALSQILMWWSPQTFAPLSERVEVLGKIVSEFPDIGWALLLEMRPTGSMTQSPTAKPRMRDLAPIEQEVLTRRVVFEGLLETIRQIFDTAAHDISRWIQIVKMMSNFPPAQREETQRRLNELIDRDLSEPDRTFLWETLRNEIARHRTFARTDWALRDSELKLWDELVTKISPTDLIIRLKWLFDDWMPDLEEEWGDGHAMQERIDHRRREAVQTVLAEAGSPGILRLARLAKFPVVVGSTTGSVVGREFDLLDDIAKAALLNPDIDERFVGSLLWSADQENQGNANRSSRNLVELAIWAKESGVPPARIAAMIAWLPAEPSSWSLVTSLGDEIEAAFWQVVSPPLSLSDLEAVKLLVSKMLDAGRATELSHMAAFGKLAIDAQDALAILDAVIEDLSANRGDRVVPRLPEFLGYLSSRSDIADIDLARREILLVPALGYHHGLHLRLFKVLAEEAGLFIDLVCQIYRPESDSGKPPRVDETERNLARRAFQLLSSWHNQLNPRELRQVSAEQAPRPFPGERIDGSIDAAKLMDWIAAARSKAKEADRQSPADNEIGQILAYSPLDPEDGAWPAKAVRAVIETHHSKDLQNGLVNERYNQRGVHSVVEGGKEEQAFSDEAKQWAKIVRPQWPRTHMMLIALAKMWERDRARAIEWERKRKLEQGL